MREASKHIDLGAHRQSEADAGCRVGTPMHRVILCERNKEVHGRKGLATIDNIRKCFKECPWDPLW